MGLLAATPVRIVFALFLSRPHGNDCVFVGVPLPRCPPAYTTTYFTGALNLKHTKEIMSITVMEAHSCLSHKKALFPIVVKFRTLVGI